MSDEKTETLDFSYYLPVNIIFGCGKADTAGKRARPYGEKALRYRPQQCEEIRSVRQNCIRSGTVRNVSSAF